MADNKMFWDVKRIYEPVMRGQVCRSPKGAVRPYNRPVHRLSSGQSSGGRHASVGEDDGCFQDVCITSAYEINRLVNQNDELAKEIETYAGRLKGAEDQKITLIEAMARDREDLEVTLAKFRQKEAENDLLKELLTETRATKKSTDEELSRTVTELENLRSLTKQLSRESDELDGMGRELDDQNSSIQGFNNQINEMQELVRLSADEYQELKRQSGDNERVLTLKDAELQSLRVLLDEERKLQQKYANNYYQCRRQLADTQSAAKQSQTEAELLRKKVYSRNEELRTSRTNLSATGEPMATVTAEEHNSLVNECQTLRSLLETFDNELQTQQLKLLTVCKEFEDFKLKSEDYFKENQTLNEDLKGGNEEIEVISYQNKIITAWPVLPLIILLVTVITAFYWSVSDRELVTVTRICV